MEKIDIFDVENLSDIPDELKKLINKKGVGFQTRPIMSLFEIKEELSIDEILLGLYRKYKLKKSRQFVSTNLYNLKKANLIEGTNKSGYRIKK